MYKLLPILLFAYSLAVTTDDIYDDSWALIIGINKYENVSNLDYAVDDANSIRNLLIEQFNFSSDNITILLNKKATYTRIKKALSKITRQASENDRILIFFAGHGTTIELPESGEMGYLLPSDGNHNDLFTTSIPMNDLKIISSMSNAKHILFLVDACYGGLAATNTRGLASSTPGFLEKITRYKSRQIITAGGRGEKVIEKAEWGHSAFTLNLLRGLKEWMADINMDGIITGEELGLFLKKKVTIDSDNQQTPQSRRFTSHEGEFVFINDTKIDKTDIEKENKDKLTLDYDKLVSEITKRMQVISGCQDSIAINYNPNAIEDDGSCIYIHGCRDPRAMNFNPKAYENDGSCIYSKGCKDPNAMNYNPNAFEDDGSCQYGKLFTIIEFLGTVENNIIPILIYNNDDIVEFEFNIQGANIKRAFGGITEEADFDISIFENKLKCKSLKGNIIPRGGNQTLINIEIDSYEGNLSPSVLMLGFQGSPYKAGRSKRICIENIILTNPSGLYIDNIYEPIDNCTYVFY